MQFEPMNFIQNLSYMGVGMLGIFIVMGVIIGAIYGLGALFNKTGKNKKDSE